MNNQINHFVCPHVVSPPFEDPPIVILCVQAELRMTI